MDIRNRITQTLRTLDLVMTASSPSGVLHVESTLDFMSEDNILTGIVRILVKTHSGSFMLEDLAVSGPIVNGDLKEAENSIMEDIDGFVTGYLGDGTYDSIWEDIDIEGECWKRE